MTRRLVVIGLTPLLLLAALPEAHAQWVARGALAAVRVVHDCSETGGDAAAARLDPPEIYMCPTLVKLVRRTHPGAEHFFLVHEFGHVAQQTTNEALADCWAAKELVRAPNGSRYLNAAIALFGQRPNEHARYGSPGERAERIRGCAEEERPNWEQVGRSAVPQQPERVGKRRAAGRP